MKTIIQAIALALIAAFFILFSCNLPVTDNCTPCQKNPTEAELLNIIQKVNCSRCGTNCVTRAECFNTSAERMGYECYTITLNSTVNEGHVLVGFMVNGQLIAIDPWNNQIVKIDKGYNYSQNFKNVNLDDFIIEQVGIYK